MNATEGGDLSMTSKEAKKLGQNIRTKRKALDWSQEELAEKVNVSKNTISNIERAETEVATNTLISLADVLDCSIDQLLGRDNSKKGNLWNLSPREIKIITMLRLESEEKQAGAEQLLTIYHNGSVC